MPGPLNIAVVIGSTRPGRRGAGVARWFVESATRPDGPALDLVDLAEHALPAVLGDTASGDAERIADLTARLGRADGFVIVTPEYNHSFPASLKQAIDWHKAEWVAKPVALVSYGGRAGGQRAAEQLRLVFAELHAMTVRNSLSLHAPWWEEGDEEETLSDPTAGDAAAALMAQLEWWATTLRDAKEARPYGFG